MNIKDKALLNEALEAYMCRKVMNLYIDKIDIARKKLNNEQLGLFFRLITDYAQLKDTAELEKQADEITSIVFEVFKEAIDHDRDKYVRNYINARNAGRPPKEQNALSKAIKKKSKEIQRNPNGCSLYGDGDGNGNGNGDGDEYEYPITDTNTGMDMVTDTNTNTKRGTGTESISESTKDYVLGEVERIYKTRRDFDMNAEADIIIKNIQKNPNYDYQSALNNLEILGPSY
ncbi:MAG: DUF6291 domain-containing protein [Saccharofermentans sp.]|nr:DUF6291 domain-containing protein [Saccharofermentans sp.]